ncbi:MAG: flagellar hook-basal body protein [Opitutaceae bacterium]
MALLGTLTTSVSALDAFTAGLDTVGNNIANINTTAFKGSDVSFADTFSNVGTQVSSTSQDFTQGALSTTGVPTDLGISGNGFFIVQDPSTGSEYATRDGQFTFNSAGYLVNNEGMEVMGLTGGTSTSGGTAGAIKLGTPPTGTQLESVSIGTDGSVTESYSDGSQAVTNQVLLQNYADPQQLVSQGDNLFGNLAAAAPTNGGTLPTLVPGGGVGTVQSGTLEQSNVDLTQEFSNMITLQRAFEANARMITISDTILEDVVNMKSH